MSRRLAGFPTALGYTGQRADSATGLDYYHARYYDPAAGQFTSADTANDGLNRYGYVHGNPTTATDPTGHFIVDDPIGDGENQFYARYRTRRANARIAGGHYLAPDSRPANAKSQKNASPTIYTLAHNVAVGQDKVGGSGAYKQDTGRRIPTVGQAAITIYAASDTDHKHPLETIYTDLVPSEGVGRHAEQLSITAIKGYIATHGGISAFQFDVNVMAGLEPCLPCQGSKQWEAWLQQLRKAAGQGFAPTGGDLIVPYDLFRLRMWYLSPDPASPRGLRGEDTLSSFHLWADSGWAAIPTSGGSSPGVRFPDFPDFPPDVIL